MKDSWVLIPFGASWNALILLWIRTPAVVYGIAGKGSIAAGLDADLVLFDSSICEPLPVSWFRSKAGFSPFVGTELAGWPMTTILRGRVVYAAHQVVGEAAGQPLRLAR